MDNKVFVIDDDAVVRTGLTRLLRTAGYDIEAFESADKFLQQEQFDGIGCLVLDLRMPGMSGIMTRNVMRRRTIVPGSGMNHAGVTARMVTSTVVPNIATSASTQNIGLPTLVISASTQNVGIQIVVTSARTQTVVL